MTAADYLTDSTFTALLAHWEEHGRPPLPLVDWLLERGLDSQAEQVRWATEQVDREGNTGVGGVRPVQYVSQEGGKKKFGWTRIQGCSTSFRSDINYDRFKKMEEITFSTYTDALLALIDCPLPEVVSDSLR